MKKLKPCIFCGCDCGLVETDAGVLVSCKSCEYQSQAAFTKGEAAASHNHKYEVLFAPQTKVDG